MRCGLNVCVRTIVSNPNKISDGRRYLRENNQEKRTGNRFIQQHVLCGADEGEF